MHKILQRTYCKESFNPYSNYFQCLKIISIIPIAAHGIRRTQIMGEFLATFHGRGLEGGRNNKTIERKIHGGPFTVGNWNNHAANISAIIHPNRIRVDSANVQVNKACSRSKSIGQIARISLVKIISCVNRYAIRYDVQRLISNCSTVSGKLIRGITGVQQTKLNL